MLVCHKFLHCPSKNQSEQTRCSYLQVTMKILLILLVLATVVKARRVKRSTGLRLRELAPEADVDAFFSREARK